MFITTKHSLIRGLFGLLATVAVAAMMPANAAYPDHSIRVIVPYSAGGNVDTVARIVSKGLSEKLKVPFVVENKPGAGSAIGVQAVAQSAPDGYTLLITTNAAFSVLPHLRKLPFDPVKDFVPVAQLGLYTPIVVASKASGITRYEQLVDKAKKSSLSFGSAGVGSVGHLAGETIRMHIGGHMLHVPYKGSSDLVSALLAGQVDFIIDAVGIPLAKAGKANALAVFAPQRIAAMPQLKSILEIDPSYGNSLPSTWWAVFVPKGTPAVVVEKLDHAVKEVLAEPSVGSQFSVVNAKVQYLSSSKMPAMMKADSASLEKVIHRADIRLE